MSAFKASSRHLAKIAAPAPKFARQKLQQRLAARGPPRAQSVPTIPTCPTPTCECADMPSDLDIDASKDLNGTMAAYSEQIIISTGQADWKSKIEDEKETAPWGTMVSQIKTMLGPKGQFHDPYRNVVVSTSSFETSNSPTTDSTQALLFPSFLMVDGMNPSESSVADFLNTFIAPSTSSTRNGVEESQDGKQKGKALTDGSPVAHPISSPTILICSHNSRDSRCGILGPLLHSEFVQYINKRHTLRNQLLAEKITSDSHEEEQIQSFASHPDFKLDAVDTKHNNQQPINVGMISHIGGHKWAGNVIVYIPPDYQINPVQRSHRGPKPNDQSDAGTENPVVHDAQALSANEADPNLSPLAGKGIWYGRVQPKHIEGIVEQTIGHGKVIRELFRGGINKDGSTIRL